MGAQFVGLPELWPYLGPYSGFDEVAQTVPGPFIERLQEKARQHRMIVHGGSTGDDGAKADSRYNVSWGFVEVLPDRVTILANDALKPAEIDVPRAERQLDRGLQLWKDAGESEDDNAALNDALNLVAGATSGGGRRGRR